MNSTDWVEAAAARFGSIDALVSNAGVTSRASIRDATEAQADGIWAVHCKAPLRTIHLCLPHLERERASRACAPTPATSRPAWSSPP